MDTVEVRVRGYDLIRDPTLNKGTGFPPEERRRLGIEGLLPDHYNPITVQSERMYRAIERRESPLDKYMELAALQDRNECLFYRVLTDHLEELMPIVYTPTVGLATQNFSHVFRRGRGVWITPAYRGRVAEVLAHAAARGGVRLIVATDGQSILGLGDQGAGGMAISVGKLALYTAGAGVDPSRTLPVCLDVGTDNDDLLADDMYLGWPHRRLHGSEYDELVGEFVGAVRQVCPDALLQWEDFRKDNALNVLARYRHVVPSFNDDVQGTGAVAVAGLLSSSRISGHHVRDQRVLVYGAGAAGYGIATRLQTLLQGSGVAAEDLCRHVAVMDSRGLIVDDGEFRDAYKRELAWPAAFADEVGLGAGERSDLRSVVERFRPTALIGVSGQPGAFDEGVVREVAKHVQRPVIMPFSNPDTLAEASPRDVIRWSDGRALVATGSPFGPVEHRGRTFAFGQGNNVLVFPGLGLGSVLVGAREVTDSMIGAAAQALADGVRREEIERGLLYPAIRRLGEVSLAIARAVMIQAVEDGVASREPAEGADEVIRGAVWKPRYRQYVPV